MFHHPIRRFLPFLILIFLVSLFWLAPARCQAEPAIFGGEGIGKIRIGETRASVLKKLGQPTKSFRWETMLVLQDTWTNKKSKSRLVVLYPVGSPRVMQVETTSPKFTTPLGLSIRSSVADAFSLLGPSKKGMLLKAVGTAKPQYYMMTYHAQKGIAFFFNMKRKDVSQGQCEKIIVFSSVLGLPLVSTKAYQGVGAEEFMKGRSS